MPLPLLRRINRLRHALTTANLDAILVSKRENITFLTGLVQFHPTNREALLFVSQKETFLYHSVFLNPPTLPGLRHQAMDLKHPLPAIVKSLFSKPTKLGFEGHDLNVNEYQKFQDILELKLTPTANLIENLRLTKDTSELRSIRQACLLSQKVASQIPGFLKLGLTEKQLAISIERALIDAGADDLAFPVVVAFNLHSTLPHHHVTSTKLTANSIILVDFGCQINGYCSDMTRTFAFGSPPPLYLQIESIVKSAYQTALTLLQSQFNVTELTLDPEVIHKSKISNQKSTQLTASAIDLAARKLIDTAGYGAQFIHTTGHGLGLEIHEAPSLSSQNQTPLQKNMVITLEPGIYLPGKFGYRYENTILLN